jgi:thioredoxin-dependent peroxiredoxin
LQADKDKFDRANAMILGVNNNTADAHATYCGKKGFTFPLLADTDLQVAKAYGAEKGGRTVRKVVVIGSDGKVTFDRPGMPTDDEILEALK